MGRNNNSSKTDQDESAHENGRADFTAAKYYLTNRIVLNLTDVSLPDQGVFQNPLVHHDGDPGIP
jgi:hypothetical protein